MKFGGSCLTDKDAFKKILHITKIYENTNKIYVASALNGITDLLLNTAINVGNWKILDDNMAIIEKRHFNIIEQIFNHLIMHSHLFNEFIHILIKGR